MRCKLVIAYDGTDYAGWQRQPHPQITVVGALERAYYKAFHKPISILGASRTDAGVHALGQVASCDVDIDIDAATLQRAWAARLPRDVHLRSLMVVPDQFHPHHNIDHKVYDYHIALHKPLPFLARYAVHLPRGLDVDKFADTLNVFVGTHDFRSFCTGDDQVSTVRRIDSIEVTYSRRFKLYRVRFKGPGFLRYMIRRIVGASLHVCGDDTIRKTNCARDRLVDVLAERNPAQQLVTAPAHGLCLRKIIYRSYQGDDHDFFKASKQHS